MATVDVTSVIVEALKSIKILEATWIQCPLVCHQTSPCLSTKDSLKARCRLNLICFPKATEVTKLNYSTPGHFQCWDKYTARAYS